MEINPQKSQIEINKMVATIDDIEVQEIKVHDYSKRAQWIRAALLGASGGVISTALLMIGVGFILQDTKTMILTGLVGLVAGACGMAIGEFVSVYAQSDIEVSQMKRESRVGKSGDLEAKKKELPMPSPLKVAAAFVVGALVPLVAVALVEEYRVRLAVVVATVSVELVGFAWLSAFLGRVLSPVKSSLRVLIGGWIAMGTAFGLTKLICLIGRS